MQIVPRSLTFATLFYNIMRSGCVARRSFRSSVCETSLLSATLLNERGEREKKRREGKLIHASASIEGIPR